MKTLIPLTALAALIASTAAYGQTPAYSKPSGYTTQVLKPNKLNYVGINVLTPSLASGAITDIESAGLALQDSKATFLTALPAGKMFTLEIVSGSATGSVREFVAFTKTKVTITASIANLKVGDKYIIRKNPTLQEIFPAGAPLTGGASTPSTADIVRVPNGDGTDTRYWYKTTTTNGPIGWWTTTDGKTRGVQVTSDIPLLYTDGIQVNRRAGVDVNLVLTGQVKTTSSRPYVVTGSNPVSINPPVGATLKNSGLKNYMQGAASSPATADILWVPTKNMNLKGYWYKNSSVGGEIGWYTTTDGITAGTLVTTKVNLSPSCLIQRRGAARFMRISVPSSYADL